MGYTTDFWGSFKLNKKLDAETLTFLRRFNETRRMKRNIKGFGVEGEFFVDGKGFAGQDNDSTVVDHNKPPKTQPGLWCQWRPNDEGTHIEWDGNEKFYNYVEWLEYLIDKVLAPKGYKLSGTVEYQGEDTEDFGKIVVKSNKVKIAQGKRTFGKAK